MIFLRKSLDKFILLSGIDFHIGITLLFRFWSVFAGGILLICIPLFLTGAEQGYYFTFSSLIATQVFFELGFNYVIVQVVSHEMAGLQYGLNGKLEGDKTNRSRMLSLINLLKKWYAVIALLFFVAISILGYYFFSANGNLPLNDWLPAWLFLVLFSSINLFISPFLALMEGIGLVGQVAKMRLIQSVIGYTCFFIFLQKGFGLYSVIAVGSISALFSTSWLMRKHRILLFSKFNNVGPRISWRNEIFPFQWKIALSWLSGYFIFQLFNPLIFAHQGAIEAGRIGFTLTIFSTILSLSMSWVTAKSPVLAKLIAQRKKDESKKLFYNLMIKSGISNALIIILFIIVMITLRIYDFSIATRVANNNILFVLFFASIANHIIFTMASYMRAHKKEPMIWNSLGTGLLISLAVFCFSMISSTAAIVSYAVIIICVCLPWTIMIYRKFESNNKFVS